MAVGKRDTYFFRGRHPEETGVTLEDALASIVGWWVRQPSLIRHEIGNLVVELKVGNKLVQFEITDPQVLDDLRYVGPQAVVEYVAKEMDIDEADAQLILDNSPAHVRVDTIRIPGDPNHWTPDPGLEPEVVLRKESLEMIGALHEQEEERIARNRTSRRTKMARELVDAAVRAGRQQGLSQAEVSRRTNIPASTLGDARRRVDRKLQVPTVLRQRKTGQRLDQAQQNVVLAELKKTRGNAAKAARNLGLPARTVRGLRARQKQATKQGKKKTRAQKKKGVWSASDRQKLLDLVKNTRVTPTEAGRQLGIPARTARGWVRKARLEDE